MKIPKHILRLIIGAVFFAVLFITYKITTDKILNDRLHAAFSSVPKDMITYKGASVSPFTRHVTINHLTITLPNKETIPIDKVEIKSIDSEHKNPYYSDLTMQGVTLTSKTLGSLNPALPMLLQQLGYNTLKADWKIDYKYNTDKKMLNIKEIALNLHKIGKITMKMQFFNVKSPEDLTFQARFAPESLTFGDVSFTYHDDSLTNRIMQLLAQKEGKSITEFKEGIHKRLQMRINQAQQNNQAFLVSVNKALMQFMQNPQSLHVTVHPDKPISMQEIKSLQNPQKIIQVLHVQFKAN
jgi:hypothetical protein